MENRKRPEISNLRRGWSYSPPNTAKCPFSSYRLTKKEVRLSRLSLFFVNFGSLSRTVFRYKMAAVLYFVFARWQHYAQWRLRSLAASSPLFVRLCDRMLSSCMSAMMQSSVRRGVRLITRRDNPSCRLAGRLCYTSGNATWLPRDCI